MQYKSLERLKQAFITGMWASLVSIVIGFAFKVLGRQGGAGLYRITKNARAGVFVGGIDAA